jgi:cell division control protein 45
MINCGGIIDIYQYLEVDDDVKIYIIDSHRPLNLDNLHGSKRNVCVFDDDDETEKLNPVLEAFSALMVGFIYTSYPYADT